MSNLAVSRYREPPLSSVSVKGGVPEHLREVTLFVKEICALRDTVRIDSMIYRIFDEMENWLLVDAFDKCDLALQLASARIEDLNPDAMLSFLTITNRARHWLPSRATFSRAVRREFGKTMDSDELEDTLAGVE
jgi:hypothetical protein